jgi:hypothetical protein
VRDETLARSFCEQLRPAQQAVMSLEHFECLSLMRVIVVGREWMHSLITVTEPGVCSMSTCLSRVLHRFRDLELRTLRTRCVRPSGVCLVMPRCHLVRASSDPCRAGAGWVTLTAGHRLAQAWRWPTPSGVKSLREAVSLTLVFGGLAVLHRFQVEPCAVGPPLR